MRLLGAVLAAAVAAGTGCTSVKMVQRDGCWVKRTEKFPKRVLEEVGPCARTHASWSEDPLVRLVQECVASSDDRWRTRALAAWTHREPWPDRPDEQSVLRACVSDAVQTALTENDKLKQRLADVAADRDAVRARADDDQKRLLAAQDKLATFLGEAAKKAAPPATATAYAMSDGKARTDATPAPAAPVALFAGAVPAAACPAPAAVPLAPVAERDPEPARTPAQKARTPRRARETAAPPVVPAPPADACQTCTAPATPAPAGNGTVTPTVAPATGNTSSTR